ncbi:MAG: transposase [Chloroflexi bacterium]|nr:transposase [Chloroflexota bacterium]
MADHLEGVKHDAVTDFLQREKLTAHGLWELVQPLIHSDKDGYLIVDDSVQDKRFSKKIELVKLQYSGNEHGLVRGIGVVNLVHSDGTDYYPIDYRIYAPQVDGKTKNEHFREMLLAALADKGILAKKILFDSWYAAADNLKLIERLKLIFVTGLKENRLVSLSVETGYVHLKQLSWSDEQLHHGQIVKLKEVPFKVRLFKVVATNGNIEWVITNDLTQDEEQVIQDENDVRWQIEQMHRELKQLTGLEQCQCRKARSQRNHIACCYQAWLSIKVKAKALGKTMYAVVHDLLSDYLWAELRQPRIPAYNGS